MRWFTDWEENDSGDWQQVRRDEMGLTEEDYAEQDEMRREYLREEFGEDGP